MDQVSRFKRQERAQQNPVDKGDVVRNNQQLGWPILAHDTTSPLAMKTVIGLLEAGEPVVSSDRALLAMASAEGIAVVEIAPFGS